MTTSFIFSYSLLSSLYICRESSTNPPLIMQNKANLLNTQMNASSVKTRDYKNDYDFRLYENKPNSNPNKPNLRNAKMNVGSVKIKDYENKRLCALRENKPKTNPISKAKKNFAAKARIPEAQGHEEKMLSLCNMKISNPMTNRRVFGGGFDCSGHQRFFGKQSSSLGRAWQADCGHSNQVDAYESEDNFVKDFGELGPRQPLGAAVLVTAEGRDVVKGKINKWLQHLFCSDILAANPLSCPVLTAGVLCTASPLFFCKCFTWNNFYENKIFSGKIAQSPLQIPKYLLGSRFGSK